MKIEKNQYNLILEILNNDGKCEGDKSAYSKACRECSFDRSCKRLRLKEGYRSATDPAWFIKAKVEFMKRLIRNTL